MTSLTEEIASDWEEEVPEHKKRPIVALGRQDQGKDIGFDVRRFVTSSSWIMAKRGGGKTYKTCATLEQIYELGHRFCMIDPMGEYHTLKGYMGDDLIVYGKTYSDKVDKSLEKNLDEVREIIDDSTKSVVINIENFGFEEAAELLVPLIKPLHEERKKRPKFSLSPVLLGIEEAERMMPEGGGGKLSDLFSTLAFESRHSAMGMMILGHRVAKVSKDPLSQADYPIIKQTTQDIDIDRISWMMRNDFGIDEKKASELIEELPSLKPWKSLFLHDNKAYFLTDYKRKSSHHAESLGTGEMFEGNIVDDRI